MLPGGSKSASIFSFSKVDQNYFKLRAWIHFKVIYLKIGKFYQLVLSNYYTNNIKAVLANV